MVTSVKEFEEITRKARQKEMEHTYSGSAAKEGLSNLEKKEVGRDIASMVPGPVGANASFQIAKDEYKKGNYGSAALNAVGGVASMIPATAAIKAPLVAGVMGSYKAASKTVQAKEVSLQARDIIKEYQFKLNNEDLGSAGWWKLNEEFNSKTGLYLDPAGNPLFYIPDNKMKIKDKYIKDGKLNLPEDSTLSFSDVIEHPELEKEYPKALKKAKIKTYSGDEGDFGSYSTQSDRINININQSPESFLSTMTHELNHKIASYEDVLNGATTEEYFNYRHEYIRDAIAVTDLLKNAGVYDSNKVTAKTISRTMDILELRNELHLRPNSRSSLYEKSPDLMLDVEKLEKTSSITNDKLNRLYQDIKVYAKDYDEAKANYSATWGEVIARAQEKARLKGKLVLSEDATDKNYSVGDKMNKGTNSDTGFFSSEDSKLTEQQLKDKINYERAIAKQNGGVSGFIKGELVDVQAPPPANDLVW